MTTMTMTQRGFTLIELVAVVAIGGLILLALSDVTTQAARARAELDTDNELQLQAQFALDRVLLATPASIKVFAPRAERAATAHSESVRNVLVLSLDPTLDRNGDGFADADNDKDGRIDEDFADDMTNDGVAGVKGIDDDGDGAVDEGDPKDDDEDGTRDEDLLNGSDDDADGLIDEDVKTDMNDDSKAGVKDVDDDGDASIDEGDRKDDDEDGALDEDWLDVVAFHVSAGVLLERMPNVNGANGLAFTERPIAENVTQFRVQYIPPPAAGRPALLDISLTLTTTTGTATVTTRTRVQGT